MTPAEKHPHLDMPSADQLRELIEGMRPALSDVYLAVHQLVLDTLPDVRYEVDRTDAGIGYGARQFGYDGWGPTGPGSRWSSSGEPPWPIPLDSWRAPARPSGT